MATTERVLHVRRHLSARKPALVGIKVPVIGGAKGETAFVANGIYLDGHAHLEATEPLKGEEIGRALYIPEGTRNILLLSSPLPRAQETEMYMFNGMVDAYAMRLGVKDLSKLTRDDQEKLSREGLHRKAEKFHNLGLRESRYTNSVGTPDEGNELVAQAYSAVANPHFSGYRWMVQKGFEGDRSEHPTTIAQKALESLVFALLGFECTLSVTHQPTLEIVTATLTGDLGTDGNKVFANAGGPFDVGGGIELRAQIKDGTIQYAQLMRTEDADKKKVLGKEYNGVKLVREMPLSMDILLEHAKKYNHAERTIAAPLPQVGFGD